MKQKKSEGFLMSKKSQMDFLGCPQCNTKLKRIRVKIQDAASPVLSYQCSKCGYFDFEETAIKRAITEIQEKETALKIKQKIIKLSQDRLGMYINRDVARCLNLKGGEDVYISVPDKHHLIVEVSGE